MSLLGFLDYILFSWGLYLVCRLFQRRRGAFPLPPGPRGYPLIGNLFDLPSSYEWLTWAKLGDEWGDLISLSVFGTTIVVINSYTQAVKMLNEKSDIYSGRPHVPMASEACDFKNTMGLLPNDRRLRSYRKLFKDGLGTNVGVRNFFPQEEDLARKFIRKVINTPENLLEHCFYHSGAIILRIAYGYEVKESNDPMIKVSTLAMDHFSKATAQSEFLVNQIPMLMKVPEWFPGTEWKAIGRKWAKTFRAMEELPFKFVKEQMMKGQAKDSFVTRWLTQDLTSQQEKELEHAAGSMFGGGTETTAITIYAFILMLCLHPEIRKSLHREIDEVVGQDRLPSFEDRDNLPYLDATLKEVMRFHTVVPTSLPHCSSEDDIHDGMFIPSGAIVIPNAWKMAHDSSVYNDPMIFDPSRFLEHRREQDPDEYIFGFGRRLCPGRLLADASIYITAAMILFAFDISPLPGAVPVYRNLTGLISRVEPFECEITPRKDVFKLRSLLDQ